MDGARRIVEWLSAFVAGGGSLLVLTDYDGTLTPTVEDPAEAWLPSSVRRLYMGDEWTDEHAFEALAGEAITVRVGTGAPASRAAFRLAGVGDVHQLLRALAAGVGKERAR